MTYHEKYTNQKIDESIKELRDEIARLNSVISTSFGKILEVKQCKNLSNYYFSTERYNRSERYYVKPFENYL